MLSKFRPGFGSNERLPRHKMGIDSGRNGPQFKSHDGFASRRGVILLKDKVASQFTSPKSHILSPLDILKEHVPKKVKQQMIDMYCSQEATHKTTRLPAIKQTT